MHQRERILYERRTRTFIEYVNGLLYPERSELQVRYCLFDPVVSFEKRLDGTYTQLKNNEIWGRNWQRAWFSLKGRVPVSWQGKTVVARVSLGGEALVFDEEGIPVYAFSNHTIWKPEEFRRDRLRLFSPARGREEVSLWLKGTAAQLFGVVLNPDAHQQVAETESEYEARLEYAELAVFRDDLWQFIQDVTVLQDLMFALPEKSVRRARILRALSRSIDLFTPEAEGIGQARRLLQAELSKPAAPSDLGTVAVGHAHIDTAWLWPIHETVEKCARTFAVQAALLDRYPDYVFGASMPQHYQFVKDHYPDLYARIKQLVQKGRWEPQGGMWVEADCNLIGGESMVRQILYGKSFFLKEFGFEVRNLWLPDVFGYSAALPQIMKKSGLDYLVTQKLSWNQFNRFPHHTFRWCGIDGTEVITHFPPEDTYNAELTPSGLIKARENYDEHDFLDQFLTLFGIGDGGGGPNEEMIESGLRQKDLESTPRVRFGSAQSLLDRIGKQKTELPLWNGELYLELHRGTLTTHAYNKKMNRLLESRLRSLELISTLLPSDIYPADDLQRLWKRLLTYQFHDIIPGSSIQSVYEECRKEYPLMEQEIADLTQKAAVRLFDESENSVVVFNTLSIPYTMPFTLPESWKDAGVADGNGETISLQYEDGIPVISLPLNPFEARTLNKVQGSGPEVVPSPEDWILENDLIRYEFGDDGTIERIHDKESGREVLAKGARGNVLSLYEDRPVSWDAWDIDIFYEQQKREEAVLLEREWIISGPVRKGLRQVGTIGDSRICQNIFLAEGSKRLDFETEADWNENHKMLRVSFTVDVYADQATYEIQYGIVKRPTHRNTSWDKARFETVAHRFADLSETDYGVAVLNDSKYGHKILNNVIDLNLLRATSMPDPLADRGHHSFVYSLLPHTGSCSESVVLSEALQLNNPPLLVDGRKAERGVFPVRLDSRDIIIESVKKAEADDALILRLYEPFGHRSNISLSLNNGFTRAMETDLLENEIIQLDIKESVLSLKFKPFEIKTLKLYR